MLQKAARCISQAWDFALDQCFANGRCVFIFEDDQVLTLTSPQGNVIVMQFPLAKLEKKDKALDPLVALLQYQLPWLQMHEGGLFLEPEEDVLYFTETLSESAFSENTIVDRCKQFLDAAQYWKNLYKRFCADPPL